MNKFGQLLSNGKEYSIEIKNKPRWKLVILCGILSIVLVGVCLFFLIRNVLL